jgi:hypothetical protein
MSAGVSPVSPVVAGTPASRTSYEATPVSPAVQKATQITTSAPPSRYDPSTTEPRKPNDGLTGFSVYA